ncbi:SWI/SNF-related matrix-associated actin-dependent regulator of chromatin subfamily A containing DEAD/H box 1 homolog [Copidosoma floridanum]|uniref:SWI/SNF-related matrix-associated actin-dependent regulator of chromatin subfamily A containing DEAD/H box 1 homolog n=1 Tax=Copidosoma floridanum TaxID=29053 RepID=UPI0006C99188|nr:SWI/SNF-related matrix-associated actin-dependent regulator of chromatin subfamily A containing DEAD/H box 1 homolog [Copidosoma floridanum]
MSDSESCSPDLAATTVSKSPSLLENLRKFRFQKKSVKKMVTSDEDSNLSAPEVRRKPVNRIDDSDSEGENLAKATASNSEESPKDDKEEKVKYLTDLFSHIEREKIKEVLGESNWDMKIAKEKLERNKKRRLEKSKKSKKTKRKKRNYRDDEDRDIDSDDCGYSNNKVFDMSDEESDYEVTDDLSGDRQAVMNFLQKALPTELLLLHQCTQKKVNAIIEARPFEGWKDLVYKFQCTKFLDTELLNAAQDLIQTRQVIDNLMKKCLGLSANMEKAVAAGSAMIQEQPKTLSPGLKLAPYQMVGLNWLAVMHAQKVNGILADEMGLGKTVQVIAFLTYLREANLIDEKDGPHLIIVPSSTIENWSNELERWSPGLKVSKYYGSQDERREMRFGWRNGDLDDVDIILTTYNLISSTPEERRLFRVMPVKYVIFDEAHMLKNMSTVRYENLVRIKAQHRILLTGTPLQNNLLELMSLLIFVMPSMFASKQNDLKNLFSKNPKINANKSDEAKPLFEEEQINNAKQIMKPFVLRRLKSDVLKDLPTKSEEVIECEMIKTQCDMYNSLVTRFSVEARETDELDGMGMMMQLRKLANHPLLLQNYYTQDKLKRISEKLVNESGWKQKNAQYTFEDLLWMSDYKINQLSRTYKSLAGFGLPHHLIPESGKLKKLDELLKELHADGHRVLIFSQFTMVLDILQEYLTIRNHRHLRLDGQTPVMERQDLIDEFTEDTDIFVFLLSTRAGGLGINLTAADTVIIHDIDFNPYNDKQAEDRCHRVGQKKLVRIIRLLSKGTIEEGMYKIAQEKLNLEKKITGNEENESKEKKSLLKLLKMTLGLDQNKLINLSPAKNGDANGFSENDVCNNKNKDPEL